MEHYRLKENSIEFPVIVDGKSKRISVNAEIFEYQRAKLTGKLGSFRITKKSSKWIAQIAVDPIISAGTCGDNIMGVDLGLKIPDWYEQNEVFRQLSAE